MGLLNAPKNGKIAKNIKKNALHNAGRKEGYFMKNTTTTTNTNTTTVTANFLMVNEYETLVSNGTSSFDALTTVNNRVKQLAFDTVITKNGILWSALVDGVKYEQLTDTLEPATKMLKVNDVFILKSNKNSYKKVLAGDLYTMLECFGANVLECEISALDDDTLTKMTIYNKYIPALDCFTCDTRTSVNQLEKQMQEFFNYFFGDKAPKAKKSHVKHLKRQYVLANKNGYRNGNALVLLQLIINHAYDCKHNIQYVVKSGLNSHKAPKENK